MSGRDEGYYGPTLADLSRGCLMMALALAAVLALAVLCATGVLA